MVTYYQPPARASLMGALFCLGAGALGAALLGVIYTLAMYYLHFVLFMLALPWLLGFGLAFLIGNLASWNKISHLLVVRILAAAIALVALYAAWGTTVYGMAPTAELPRAVLELTWRPYLPKNIFDVAQYLFHNGYFVMHEGDPPLLGWPLAAVWAIEAAIVVGVPLVVAPMMIVGEVLCERCDVWVPGKTVQFLAGTNDQWQSVQQGDWEVLSRIPRVEPGVRPYVRLVLHACNTCDECNYLTATSEEWGPDGKPRDVVLIDRLQIPQAAVESVRNSGVELPPEDEQDYEEEEKEDP